MDSFLGMRGTGDWATDERPKSWRETILFLYPNGMVPLTAILSKMGSEKVTDPQFYWWTKTLPLQAGTVTGRYTDSLLSVAYGAGGGVKGTILYLKMSEVHCKEFRVGHQVVMRDDSDWTVDVIGKVVARAPNGSSSYIAVKLLEADDNSAHGHFLNSCDKVIVAGSINPEGGNMPTGISYNPVKYTNYTQIMRTPLSITRTARETTYRTGDKYKEMKREALEIHGVEMERASIWGIPTEEVGENGKPERTSGGILYFIRNFVPANVSNFALDAVYSGKAWTDIGGGKKWLDAYLEQVFRYGAGEKLALCGSGALLGINALAESGAHLTLETRATAYGIKITEWITPFGTIMIKTHPLMSVEVSTRNMMMLLEPKNLKYRFITDTTFYGEGEAKQAAPGTNYTRKDGTDEEFLTEFGLEFWHPDTMMALDGVGQDNAV